LLLQSSSTKTTGRETAVHLAQVDVKFAWAVCRSHPRIAKRLGIKQPSFEQVEQVFYLPLSK